MAEEIVVNENGTVETVETRPSMESLTSRDKAILAGAAGLTALGGYLVGRIIIEPGVKKGRDAVVSAFEQAKQKSRGGHRLGGHRSKRGRFLYDEDGDFQDTPDEDEEEN